MSGFVNRSEREGYTFRLSTLALIFFCVWPFVSYAKVATGFAYGPVFLDLILFSLFLVMPTYLLQIQRSGLVFIMLGLFIVSVLQIFNNYDDDLIFKLKGFRTSGLYMLGFFFGYYGASDRRFRMRFYKWNLVIGVVVMLLAIRQLILPFGFERAYAQLAGTGSTFLGDTYERDDNLFRIFATFSASTHFAAYCLWIFTLSGAAFTVRLFNRKLVLSALLLSVVGLSITYSRTSLIALPISALMLTAAVGRLRGGFRGAWAAMLLAVVLIPAGFLAASFVPMLGDRLQTFGSVENVSSLSSRLLIWVERLKQISQRPWGYGTGLAGFQDIENTKLVADSQYLKTFIEWGWAAGATFVAVLVYLILHFYRSLGKNGHKEENVLLMSTCAYVAGMMVIMLTGQILEAYPIGIMFWYVCGLTYFMSLRMSASTYV